MSLEAKGGERRFSYFLGQLRLRRINYRSDANSERKRNTSRSRICHIENTKRLLHFQHVFRINPEIIESCYSMEMRNIEKKQSHGYFYRYV